MSGDLGNVSEIPELAVPELAVTGRSIPELVTPMASTAARRSRRARWVVGVVVLVLVVLVGVLATRPAAQNQAQADPLVGQQAPPLLGTTLNGQNLDLAQYRGRFVVVNFFATWCAPCQKEHPELKAFVQSHAGESNGPALVGVAYDSSDVPAARAFFAQKGGNWPVVATGGSGIAVNYGVRGLPESFVVGPDGMLRAHLTGGVTAAALNLLTQPAPAPTVTQ